MKTTSAQKQVIRESRAATERFREAMMKVNQTFFNVQEISQEEFVARRNRVGSRFYKFRHTSSPLTKSEIKNLFK